MNIAMIGQKGYPAHYGGVERHVAEISERLVRDGHNVTVYNRAWYGGKQHGDINGISVATIPTIRTKHLDAIVHTFLSTFHAIYKKADIIHYHGVGPALLSWIPRVFSPKTLVVVTFHSIDRYHDKWGWFARTMLRLGEKFACFFPHETTVIAPSLQQYCQKEFKTKTHYIPNGVTIKNTPHRTKTNILFTFGLAPENYIMLVGRLIPIKAAHILIDAFADLKDHHKENEHIQQLKLAIVGGSAYTNDYVTSLHTQASRCNDIVFTEFQSGDALEDLYRNALALVHPSISEGMPLVVLEAMGYAKPVLVSAIPEHLQLIQNPNMLFRENDVTALEKKLHEFFSFPKETRMAIGEENQAYVTEHHNWDTSTALLINLYETTYRTRIQKMLPDAVIATQS
ncbi:MAG: hypothetical protein UV82_C0001G0024 [Candidatus Magasanikbacteria bacterium GW2011_GWD2_43_18]|uniref:Glycosyltransferase n=1 Tax=Candidatus Magasanikbacteria bacterium GW2011_GWE2_42_7 TaxID=1619052 RepID=A0A0G1DPX0_9BACT|nr:MAG: hypothetical protein UV18_C0001G0057 [Candidatus Magasanikbacteria bacterium GW2011_GWC2_42_27]KKS72876.1 MAG: hypothetical protein UV42_C0003G0005 [Candidatus Magasanikbacteria bacterium GW2011_GWE2_42_7]KKT05235.1 MAG: hypothetical protein UV82_C0001G0024 [Candidatus Magasanikbacteria bacterium GW2011_GWD2_43_18]KKT26143.1 MAG: hypothetical protein UW10_C0001G0057 [Candidatus Magasanikbacteria bacterium GW2011_GWA2_43_9]HBB37572.1 hypothetical protein [Candidatus Magasanikbacteria bac